MAETQLVGTLLLAFAEERLRELLWGTELDVVTDNGIGLLLQLVDLGLQFVREVCQTYRREPGTVA